MNIMTHNVPETVGTKDVYIRIATWRSPNSSASNRPMGEQFDVKYWAIDSVHTVL